MKKRKTEILQFRLTPEDKELIEKGAAFRNLDMSDYVRMNIIAIAKQEIEERTKITLNTEEWDQMMEIVKNPSPINPSLKRAFDSLCQLESNSEEDIQENFG